jgi:uncharacterized protein involved in exopolysaccharide biosynthesis
VYRERLEGIEDEMAEKSAQSPASLIEKEMANNLDMKKDLETRLSGIRDEYIRSKFLDNKTIEARMQLLTMTIKDIEDRNSELQKRLFEQQRLVREAELVAFSFETFAKRGEEARVNEAIAKQSLSGDVSILSRAQYSAERVFPKRLLTLVLGLIVGFITGCSIGFTVEYFDHTFKKPTDVSRYAGLPVICSIREL